MSKNKLKKYSSKKTKTEYQDELDIIVKAADEDLYDNKDPFDLLDEDVWEYMNEDDDL